MPRHLRALPVALGMVVAVLLGASACDDDTPSTPTPSATPCTSGQLTGPYPGGGASRSQPVGVSGGTYSASVAVTGDCQWTVISDVPWTVVSGGPAFRGSQALNYVVPANPGASRAGRLTYSFDSMQTTYIVQDGAISCATEISPTARSFLSRQSAIEVHVFASTGCKWAFEGNGSWLTVVPEEDHPSPWGDGNGTVLVIAAANTNTDPRTGTATIAGKTLTITQDGTVTPACQYLFAPTTHSFSSAGGAGQVSVSTGADCTWVLDEIGDAWIKAVTAGRYFRGPGAFQFSVDASVSAQSRTGMFWLTGTSAPSSTRITVEQAAR